MHSYLSIPSVSMTTVEVQSGEGFSHEQQLNNSGFVSVRVEEIRVFQACTCGWRCDTKCRALAPTRKCAFFASVSVPEVSGCSVALSIAVGLRRSRRCFVPTLVLNESHSFFVLSQD